MISETIRWVGPLVPYTRPRFNSKTRSTYTDPKYKKFKQEIAAWAELELSNVIAKPQAVRLVMLFGMGPRSKNAEKQGIEEHIKTPDLDNLGKSILDALNKIAFEDDSQVVELVMRKEYSAEQFFELTLEAI